ncbi:RNA polymerase sigma-70 factor, ECF subfamily [Cyclobacterium lianum]|uniref:RNA polymerase sigma factor n=1 Tax=Cyclobacterium lianum TaxID=388280 RepID=A0A1M7L5I9_9BACT|nr:sigma-70 family RNA polymerase sigma factor [Cyclobacterium lianum]SHM73422.1 RNA polymerase sigma-70 factor, ECF subfamily [Cyclobacterium lianum]
MYKATDQDIPKLVKMLKGGDEAAYMELFELFTPKIYRSSRKMNLGHEDAEEIVQEVFLKVWHYRKELNEALSFNAYLLTIMRSLIFKKSRRLALEIAFRKYRIKDSSFVYSPTEDDIFRKELADFSETLIAKLPKGQQEVIHLKYMDNLTADEIAAKLHLSKRTVENQLYKATKRLSDHLSARHIRFSDFLQRL